MRTKPWPIVILAVLYFLGPLFNTLAGAAVMHVSYWQYLHALFHHASWFDISLVFLLYPIAGFAIFSVKEWSYPVYLAVMAASVYLNYNDWRHYSTVFTLPIFVSTTFINVGLVSYFLLPAVRSAYFNKRLRWWEAKPRFEIQMPGTLTSGDQTAECSVLNLSEGGAFLSCSAAMQMGAPVSLKFTMFGRPVQVSGKIVHQQTTGVKGCGVQFIHDGSSQRQLRRMAKALQLIGVQARGQAGDWQEDLKTWAAQVFKTGKGLVPEVPESALAKKDTKIE